MLVPNAGLSYHSGGFVANGITEQKNSEAVNSDFNNKLFVVGNHGLFTLGDLSISLKGLNFEKQKMTLPQS